MTSNPRIYRCNLFSFVDPRAARAILYWARDLQPLDSREVPIGETVELIAEIEDSLSQTGKDAKISFEILRKGFILSQSPDDIVASIRSTAAGTVSGARQQQVRAVMLHQLGPRETVEEFVQTFKQQNAGNFEDYILFVEDSRSDGVRTYLLTWWAPFAQQDRESEEVFFRISVDEVIMADAKDTIEVVSAPADEAEIRFAPGADTGTLIVNAWVGEPAADLSNYYVQVEGSIPEGGSVRFNIEEHVNGSFRKEGVPPGEYKAMLVRRGPQGPPGPALIPGPKAESGDKGEKGEPSEPGFDMDPVYLAEFNSAWNRAVDGWGFVGDKQVLAIDSIYTEAKKPKKPSLAEELLIILAMAALAGTLNVIGVALAAAITTRAAALLPKRVFFDTRLGMWVQMLGGKRTIINEARAHEIMANVPRSAKLIGEFSKDAFKDAIKTVVKPTIKALLDGGKEPIDAFFEGQMATATDAAKEAHDNMETLRVQALKNSPDPLVTAQVVAEAMNDIYEVAMKTQKEGTLTQWLLYQAGGRLGTVKTGKVTEGEEEVGTNLSGTVGWSGASGYDHIARPTVPGVIFLNAYVTRGGEIRPYRRFYLPGLSRAMLKMLEDKPIKDLGLPVVYAITNKSGVAEPATNSSFTGEENIFNIRVNEKGQRWVSRLYPRHEEFLARYGGAKEPVEEGGFFSSAKWADSDVEAGATRVVDELGQTKLKGRVELDKD